MVAVKKFRPFLVHQEFTLRTDNSALGWLKRWSLHEGGMIARWILHLNSFSMKFEHRPRAHHKNADGLTRMQHHLDKPGFSPSDPARMPGFRRLMTTYLNHRMWRKKNLWIKQTKTFTNNAKPCWRERSLVRRDRVKQTQSARDRKRYWSFASPVSWTYVHQMTGSKDMLNRNNKETSAYPTGKQSL